MSTPAKIGGYNHRFHLDKVMRANQDMTGIILTLTGERIPPGLAIPLMRLAALLAEQSVELSYMQSIREART